MSRPSVGLWAARLPPPCLPSPSHRPSHRPSPVAHSPFHRPSHRLFPVTHRLFLRSPIGPPRGPLLSLCFSIAFSPVAHCLPFVFPRLPLPSLCSSIAFSLLLIAFSSFPHCPFPRSPSFIAVSLLFPGLTRGPVPALLRPSPAVHLRLSRPFRCFPAAFRDLAHRLLFCFPSCWRTFPGLFVAFPGACPQTFGGMRRRTLEIRGGEGRAGGNSPSLPGFLVVAAGNLAENPPLSPVLPGVQTSRRPGDVQTSRRRPGRSDTFCDTYGVSEPAGRPQMCHIL